MMLDNFEEVKIGNQIWMSKNLSVDKFNNGDLIIEAKSNEDWVRASENKIPAWCCYNNDLQNDDKFGKLYNYYTLIDPRGFAPEGWIIPSEDDWQNLFSFAGTSPAKKLKSNKFWNSNIENGGIDQFGFSGLPGGYRKREDGEFVHLNSIGSWWTLGPVNENQASFKNMIWNWKVAIGLNGHMGKGLSVRCLRGSKNRIESKRIQKSKGYLDLSTLTKSDIQKVKDIVTKS
jgi:uncharacterized protein (TIGR02145 family)